MPSSISSSSQRAPELRWATIWAVVTVLTLLGLAGIEAVARVGGITPGYEPSPRLWSYWNDRAHGDRVVVLGTSKAQLAVDPAVLAEELDREVINLSVNGASPLPFLHELARREDFRGTVVCGFPYAAIFNEKPTWEAKSERYLAYHYGRGFTESFENEARFWLQGNLAFLQPQVEPLAILRRFARGRLPEPFYVTMRFDRYQRADYAAADAPKPPEASGTPLPVSDAEVLAARLEQIARSVAAIRARGGEVVFVRHPSSGATFDAEQSSFPRERFAARFEAVTGARVIDFQTFDGISSIDCPDGVHLDYRDSSAYTIALAAALRRELPRLAASSDR